MNIFERVKNILINPKKEWEVIATETSTVSSLFMGYVLPLTVIGAVAAFIGYGLIGVDLGVLGIKMSGTKWGLYYGLNKLIVGIIAYYVSVYVVDMLANSFASEKDLNRSAQLVAYGTTPAMIGAFFSVLPAIALLGVLVSLYSIYVWYLGLGPVKKTPEDKKVVYMIVSVIVYIIVMIIIGVVVNKILQSVLGLDLLSGFGGMKFS
ncbi:MAG: Yip1 family protein [Ferruginibacter sp.]